MSFGAYARRARDPRLPYGQRVSMPRSCVQLHRPIGFHATLSLLAAQAGPFESSRGSRRADRDDTALLRALEVLEASRAAWHAELRAYDAERRGSLSPAPAARNPYEVTSRRWAAAPREGALHALAYILGRGWTDLAGDDPAGAELKPLVTACLAAGGPLTPGQLDELTDCVRRLRGRAPGSRTCGLLWAAWHMEVAAS
ncbi:hypothetical protein [Streptomyces sp. NPDC021020]|uniref:hypothetical protein n=1 Tax=Streptomyces sp. NPDC021020 TaxID=3365109 RepID=UPI003797A7FB